ncbi:MAG: ankyrin repeat domain-containing protein [Gemmatimonadota bacterium]
MADAPQAAAPTSNAPSHVLMALYMNDRDRAQTLADGVTLTLPELAAFGHVGRVARHVTEHPDDLQVYSPDGWTALHLAGYFGFAAVTVYLLRAGASHAARSTNAQGNTPLHAAIAGRRELPVITALLSAGSDATAVDAQGYTPLHLAASRGDVAVSELLMACGADPAVRTRDGKLAGDLAREHGHPDLAASLSQP